MADWNYDNQTHTRPPWWKDLEKQPIWTYQSPPGFVDKWPHLQLKKSCPHSKELT